MTIKQFTQKWDFSAKRSISKKHCSKGYKVTPNFLFRAMLCKRRRYLKYTFQKNRHTANQRSDIPEMFRVDFLNFE